MYLTRMMLNPARRGTRRLLASPQRMHAAVMSSVPPSSDSQGRMLWRVDEIGAGVALYLVSQRPHDLTHLVEQAGWPTTESWETRGYSGFLARLAQGQSWHFRLTANPVRQVRVESQQRSHFQTLRTIPSIEEWLVARQQGWGFELSSNGLGSVVESDAEGRDVVVSGVRQLRFARQGQRRAVVIGTATFEGNLTVTDPEALRSALVQGMGRARGYGCGLMTLAPR